MLTGETAAAGREWNWMIVLGAAPASTRDTEMLVLATGAWRRKQS